MTWALRKRLCYHKAYVEKGLALLAHVKYALGLFAIASGDIVATFALSICFALASYLIGRAWYRRGWMEAENEVSNDVNLFVKEMRRKLK